MSFEKLIRIPNDRIGALIGKSGNVKSSIEKSCYVSIDIDGDINPDGFLISQYKIDKNGNKNFTKNRYMTFELFKKKIDELRKKGGDNMMYKLDKEINGKNATVILDENKYNDVINKFGKDLDKLGVKVTIIVYKNDTPTPYYIPSNNIHGIPPVMIRNDTYPYYNHNPHYAHYPHYRGRGFFDNILDGFTFGLGFEFADMLIPDG